MNVFKLQVRALAESTNELLLLLTDEKAHGDCMGGWTVREAADGFSLGVFTVHKAPKRVHEHPHVRLPCFASPSASVAPLLALTSQGSLLLQAGSASCTQHPTFHLLGAKRMPVKLQESTPRDYPTALSTHPKRHPVKTSTCKPALFVNRTLRFISIKVNKP